ncbi:hypothetical protein [Methanimicrococcus stummii]|uniref:hypothetical protein n=1 Tax=Methanimicrococcus stummii TaxID=3028294 RepID=UPI00292F7FB0|nr:hypothetical protein [Methanimicrococcus sp. Es2]
MHLLILSAAVRFANVVLLPYRFRLLLSPTVCAAPAASAAAREPFHFSKIN